MQQLRIIPPYLLLADLGVMSSAPLRLMLRHNRVVARRSALRHASTTSEATQAASNTAAKGKEAASAAASKVSGGLSRVTSSVSGAVQGVSNSVNRMGGRLGRLLNFVQCKLSSSISREVAILGQLMPEEPAMDSILPLVLLQSQTPQASHCLRLSTRSYHALEFSLILMA